MVTSEKFFKLGMSVLARFSLGLLVLTLSACPQPIEKKPSVETDTSAPPDETLRSINPDFFEVEIFWGTDRNVTESSSPAGMFGGNRGSMTYGKSNVSIPHNHELGQIEAPSIWRFEFREDPRRHIVLLPDGTTTLGKQSWFSSVKSTVDQYDERSAFVFIHGFNTTFKEAVQRTAQIAYDLQFPGAPILYSWPSSGRETAYLVDETNAKWSEAHLVEFLQDIRAKSGADAITLIAHSMGGRLLSGSLKTLASRPPAVEKLPFNEIILAAPDIDAEIFKRDIVPAMAKISKGRTLYASSKDQALAVSGRIHGAPRAGNSGSGIVVVPGLETIDASNAEKTDFFGHTYIAEKSMLSDMFYIIREGKRASQRALLREAKTSDGGVFWRLGR